MLETQPRQPLCVHRCPWCGTWNVVYSDAREFELDIDLKILRAARHGRLLSLAELQAARRFVLGRELRLP